MGTRICKIVEEMAEIIEPKVCKDGQISGLHSGDVDRGVLV